MARRVYPVPELVLDDYIRVDDTRDAAEGSMDNNARIMRVPLLDTPTCRHVRAHEMAHAKYSPKRPVCPKGVPQMIVQRVEDMRMNNHCRRQGLDEAMDAPLVTSTVMWDKLLRGDMETLSAGISCFATGDWKPWLRESRASTEDIEFIESLWDEMSDNPTWEQTQALSKRVAEYLDIEEDDSGSGDGSLDSKSGDGGDEPMDFEGDPLDAMVDAAMEAEMADAGKTPFEIGVDTLKHHMAHRSGTGKIIAAKIVTPPLTQRMAPSKFKSRAKVAADRGMVPNYMNRYCSDKAIFAGRGKKRDNGGTILIDCSGSMHIDSDDVDEVMNIAPLGTIATYCGVREDGEIRIVAKNGKRATKNLTNGEYYGNVVDVPALEWMVKQPGPYFWVCDGGVSGADPDGYSGEVFGHNIYERCLELVERHGIIMVPNLGYLTDVMAKTLGR